jgi:hypothetical protein
MKIPMRGVVTEAKLKADGIHVTIKNVHLKDIAKLGVLVEAEKEAIITIEDDQTELPSGTEG